LSKHENWKKLLLSHFAYYLVSACCDIQVTILIMVNFTNDQWMAHQNQALIRSISSSLRISHLSFSHT